MMYTSKITWNEDEHGCHICTSHGIDSKLYPRITIDGKVMQISRFLYNQLIGEIPTGMVIRHKCDNPKCINIEHLELGTVAENMKDRDTRGRNGKRKLSDIDYINIKSSNESQTKLAKQYGVSQCTISKIINNKLQSLKGE